ncbi:T9SS type A sorting domain-containing protein [Geofilum rhodophaeum]|uniref:T9SS type A sorting domain-containing protein n=1 Tax=Geofilum rhodophaeum TaxID=1965019 RepID=UPI000B5287F2|nr:T9SS type A sorting domain-containing protein [Geofilum rhodophaeum]
MMIKQIVLLTTAVLVFFSVNGQDAGWMDDFGMQKFSSRLDEQMPGFISGPPTMQRLDSIIYYDYDEDTKEWSKKTFRLSIFYDHHFNDTLILQSIWDAPTSSWLHLAREMKEFDEYSRIETREFYLKSRSATRIQYVYDENDDLIETTESYLKSDEWRHTKRNAYSYSSESLLLTDTLYYRYSFSDGPVWRPIGATKFYYDSNGGALADTTYFRPWLDGDNFGEWEFFGTTMHEYSVNEHAAETTFTRWDYDLNQFRPYLKEKTVYHSNGFDIGALIDLKWNNETALWDTIKMRQYSYSKDDFMISYTKQTWGDSSSKVFELLGFDYTVNKEELLLPTSALDANPHIAFHHKVISKESFSCSLGCSEAQKFRETKYFYSPFDNGSPVALSNNPSYGVTVSPNPSEGILVVRFPFSYQDAIFKLFDLNGKALVSKSVRRDEQVNISQLPFGFYVYSLEVDSRVFVGKLLVK